MFRNGESGMGYYADEGGSRSSRKRERGGRGAWPLRKEKVRALSASEIEALLKEAEQHDKDTEPLNSTTLKKMMLGFEKKITQNQLMVRIFFIRVSRLLFFFTSSLANDDKNPTRDTFGWWAVKPLFLSRCT